MAATKTLLTAEDLFTLPDSGRWRELVRGEPVKMAPPGGAHGGIAGEIARLLGNFVQPHGLGHVLVEAGFVLARNPDTVRGPDVSFLAADRLSPEGLPEGYIEGPPTLAVEVRSPNDTSPEMQAKVADYVQAGTPLVWVLDPRSRTVTVYEPGGTPQRLQSGDTLTAGTVLPGFAIQVHSLFE